MSYNDDNVDTEKGFMEEIPIENNNNTPNINSGSGYEGSNSTDYLRRIHFFSIFFHIVFKLVAFVTYWIMDLFVDSFAILFLIILLLLVADFWVTKNVTGRMLAGVRGGH